MLPVVLAPSEVVRQPVLSSAASRRRRLRARGLSLVELSVVVTITGILATLATYSVRERVNEAHSIEAIAMLGNMRTGLLVKSNDLSGNSGDVLQIGGRVGGFGGPLGLPGVLGKNGNGNGNSSSSGNGNGNSSSSGNGNGNSSSSGSSSGTGSSSSESNGKKNDSDGDGNNGHGNNEDGCDPDNPGNGGKNCGGGDDSSSSSNDSSGSSSSGSSSGSSGSSSGSSSSSGSGSSSSSGSGSSSSGSSSASSGSSSSGSSASSVEANSKLCGSASPVPSSLESIKGHRYQSRASEWSGTRTDGWRCLSVSMSGSQRFQYGYDVGSSAIPTTTTPAGADGSFAAWARGDLDADGRTSWYVLNGATYDGRVVVAPAISIVDKGE